MANFNQGTGREPWHTRFRTLMPFVVHDILLVTSAYDAFTLEEDGPLTDRLFAEYSELSLLMCPRIIRTDSVAEAMEILKERHFDMVVTAPRLEDVDANTFGRRVKELYPQKPVILLAFSELDLNISDGVDPSAIDQVFLWTGDAKILFAIVKYVEDKINAVHDISQNGSRLIIFVEDSIKDYSAILSTLYSEILTQSHSIMADASNTLHKMWRIRSRPKVLLSNNYEEAVSCLRQYGGNVMGLITDARFKKDGVTSPTAGIELIKFCRKELPDLPILLESNEPKIAAQVEQLNIQYIYKNAEDLMRQIRRFLKVSLGFGEFVFKLPDDTEICRARNLGEMESILRSLPEDSLRYHASKNNFSTWLNARSMFEHAAKVKNCSFNQFDGIEDVRKFLIDIIRHARAQEQEGSIVDFSPRDQLIGKGQFIRLGKGSTGGKGRGIAFVNSLLANGQILRSLEGLEIRVPRTLVICTDEFDEFLVSNNILEKIESLTSSDEIRRVFSKGRFSRRLMQNLKKAITKFDGPLAVRSSSLLEDSHFMSVAGIYSTYLIPNSHPDTKERFGILLNAIKSVYASVFSLNAKSFIESTPYRIEDEKMAIVIQEVIGDQHDERYYPDISGVAMSCNFYPVGPQTAEDGVAQIALGLGQTVVEGRKALRFSPGSPKVLPQFTSAQDALKNSQSTFYALDMSGKIERVVKGSEPSFLNLCELADAEKDGTLVNVGSVYCAEDDVIRDNFMLAGPKVVTFNNVLKYNSLPLAQALRELLPVLRTAVGSSVEIEFAVKIAKQGDSEPSSLFILQIRPVARRQLFPEKVDLDEYSQDQILCKTERSLGHGIIESIRDVVFVKPQSFLSKTSRTIATEVGSHCKRLREQKKPFLLIGPGRWGSADDSLGIPVEWSQIAGVTVIVEANFKDRVVKPSEGMHFFQNITSLGIGYLTVPSEQMESNSNTSLDLKWLSEQPAVNETPHVRHLQFEDPISCLLDGAKGKGIILKPGAKTE